MSPARLCAAVVLCAASLFAGDAAAQAPALPDPREAQPERPSVATHAFSVAPGYVEVEAGFQRQPDGSRSSVLGAPVVFKVGLSPRLQLGIGLGWQRMATDGTAQSGVTDSVVSLKWRLIDESAWLGAFALQASVSLPTGSEERDTGTGSPAVGLLAISSRDIGPVAVDLNFSYLRRGGDGTVAPVDSTLWAVAAGFPVAGRLGWVAEVFGYPTTTGPSGSEATVGFLTGPSVVVNRAFVLDAGVVISIDGLGETAVYGGFTWNMGRAWGRPPAPPASRDHGRRIRH